MRVLIVEDDPSVANALKSVIESDEVPHEAAIVGSCEEARGIIQVLSPYDLVILDLRLPDGDGLSLAEVVQRRDPLTDIVILTGQGSLDDAARAIRNGVTDFVTKPVTRADVHDMLVRAETRTAIRRGPEEQRGERMIALMGDITARLAQVEAELRAMRNHA